MQVKRILTNDGSDSLYVPELDETYHSTHGAIQESTHVFIKSGLEYFLDKEKPKGINILEFGFGTGLNALLTLAKAKAVKVSYLTLEKFPLEPALAGQLNYGDLLDSRETFEQIITCPWESWQDITDNFKLLKQEIDFFNFVPQATHELIYFDAFAPSKQPELWSPDILGKCYAALKKHGVMVTYSAKGQLRRDLEQLGFIVERLPGPPGKHEMIRAVKS